MRVASQDLLQKHTLILCCCKIPKTTPVETQQIRQHVSIRSRRKVQEFIYLLAVNDVLSFLRKVQYNLVLL